MGTAYGNRGRGRPKTRFSDNIKEIGGGRSFVALYEMAQDRDAWRATAVQFEPTNKTPMEQQISELLKDNKNVTAPDKELTPAEEEALKAMSLEEALERRNELRKMRALQTYQEAKARRQNKIKSKKYHRFLKRDRLKKQMKEFDELKKLNPELALEKLEELDKNRIDERMSLKHRNTGKWAKHHMIRAKYNNESREALRDQIGISKNLTAKRKAASESEDEEERPLVIDIENKKIGTESSDEEQQFDEKTFTSENGFNNKHTTSPEQIPKLADDEDEPSIDETLDYKKTMEDFDFKPSEAKRIKVDNANLKLTVSKQARSNKSIDDKKVEIDPTKFISLDSKHLKSSRVNFAGIEEEVLESETDDADDSKNYMTISEAFADDDVIEEFKAVKVAIVDKDTPKDIDLTLPGWGSWGGPGLKVSKRKRKRFIFKAKPALPRKDRNLGNVIINENGDRSVATHQVSELPYQFTSVEQFQNNILMPVGKTWNPETAFKLLTKPKVVTKLGAIIAPMDTDALVNSTATKKKLPVRKKKNHKKT
ncbi:U3 small nucleolar RNA-associated protein 14 A [Nymphon striatum]|nr:U3 small nucleolar RNA-associated protein 14 A [Nymphon striatum]